MRGQNEKTGSPTRMQVLPKGEDSVSEEDRKKNPTDPSNHYDPVQFAYEQSGELTDLPPTAEDRLREKNAGRQKEKR